jgi:site-specific DNA recombinase
MSGIAGDPKRGTGILNNELYIGRVIWGRSRWLRSARDSSKRTCQQNPREQWTVYEDERLRIIDQALWNRVRNRQQAQSERIGERVSAGLSKTSAKSTGRSPRYLFSSLLKCGVCGSSYTIRGRTHYACGRHLDGRACSQTKGVKRAVVEPGLLHGIRAELLSDEAVQAAINAAHHVLAAQRPADDGKQIGKLKAEVDHLADAIAGGALRSSPALASRLANAEKALATLEAAEPAPKAAQMIPKLVDEYRAWVNELETILSPDGLKRGLVSDRDIARARAQLRRRLGGNIIVTEASDEIRFETEASVDEMSLRMAGNGSQVFMVAGAGFEPATFGL